MQNFRLRLREILDRLQEKWLQWKASHPGWIRAYTVFSAVSLLVFLFGLFFFEDARKISNPVAAQGRARLSPRPPVSPVLGGLGSRRVERQRRGSARMG